MVVIISFQGRKRRSQNLWTCAYCHRLKGKEWPFRPAHETAGQPLLRTYTGIVPLLAKLVGQTDVVRYNPVEFGSAYRTFLGQLVAKCHLAIVTSHGAEGLPARPIRSRPSEKCLGVVAHTEAANNLIHKVSGPHWGAQSKRGQPRAGQPAQDRDVIATAAGFAYSFVREVASACATWDSAQLLAVCFSEVHRCTYAEVQTRGELSNRRKLTLKQIAGGVVDLRAQPHVLREGEEDELAPSIGRQPQE